MSDAFFGLTASLTDNRSRFVTGVRACLILAFLAGHYFSRPIRKLVIFVHTVSHDHDFSQRLESGRVGEIGHLYDGVNSLLDEIKQSENELQRLGESRTRKIIESGLDGAILINGADDITCWSKQTEVIFGWSENEVLNRRISVAGLHRDGHEIAIEISLSAIRQQGTWTINAFIRDLSDQKKAEEKMLELQAQLRRQDKLVAVGQLTATVAHELRNPMGTIRNSLYLITQKLVKEPVDTTSLVNRIDRNIERCDAIISELLDFTRDREILMVPTVIDSWLARLLKGAGIPAGDRERIFDPLYSTRVYGIGLGLPTVRKIMEKHGGEVSITSAPEGGTRATLWLNINNSSVCEN